MDRKNIIILGFAIVAIGLFVIPSTMSMFVGQHTWYSVRTADEQGKLCARCHWAEVSEWQNNVGGAHDTYKLPSGADPGCFCHQINETRLEDYGFNPAEITDFGFEIFNESGNISNDSDSWLPEWRTNTTPHAAITIGCVDCHYNASDQLNQSTSAHRQFQAEARNATGASSNTACLACHTMIGLNITMERVWSGINITANHSNYTSDGWELTFEINQSNRTTDYNWTAPTE